VTTDIGAPAIVAAAEREPLDAVGAARVASLVAGCWPVLDRAVRNAPAAKAPSALDRMPGLRGD